MRPFADRRDSYRLHLDPGQAVVTVRGGPPVELRDLSASGGRLIVREAGIRPPQLGAIEVELAGRGGFRARPDIVRVRSHEPGVYHLGARFGLAPDGLRCLAGFVAEEWQRRTSDPARLLDPARSLPVKNPLFVRNLFERREAGGATLSVIHHNLRLGAELQVEAVEQVEGSRVIRVRLLPGAAASLTSGRPYHFLLRGAGAVTVFESLCRHEQGSAFTLAFPKEIRQAGSRGARRLALPAAHAAQASVSCVHPRLPGVTLRGPVLDMADRGLSFSVPAAEHGLFPGDRLGTVRIEIAGRVLQARALVRAIGHRGDPDRVACGLELRGFASRQEAEAWRRLVFQHMHPGIADGRGIEEVSFDLLESSGYLDLWTRGEARDQIKQAYVEGWRAASPKVGHAVVLHRADQPVGTVAATLIAPRSWMLHHLACDSRGDTDARLPLATSHRVFAAILHRLQAETDLETFVIYLERGKRWNERLYVDFVDRYFDKDRIELSPLEVYRRRTDPVLPEAWPPDVEVAGPTPERLALLGQALAATCSPLESEALALDEERLLLTGHVELCRREGQERAREIRFALVGGQPRAALIADSGETGVNTFGLLNTCRLVALGEGCSGATEPAVREALLRTAIAHYHARGKPHFLFFDQPGADDTPVRLGFEHVSAGQRWIAHRDVIPVWAAYLEGLLAS